MDRSDSVVMPDCEANSTRSEVVRKVLEVTGKVAACLIVDHSLLTPRRILIEVETAPGLSVRSVWTDNSSMN